MNSTGEMRQSRKKNSSLNTNLSVFPSAPLIMFLKGRHDADFFYDHNRRQKKWREKIYERRETVQDF